MNRGKSFAGRIAALQRRSLILFFLLTALLFCFLFVLYTQQMHLSELTRRAESIARELPGMLSSGRGSGAQGQGMGPGMRMGGYLRFLDDIAQAQTWLIDRTADSVLTGKNSRNVSQLPPQALAMIEQVYEGKTVTSTSFRGLLEGVSATVGTPVRSDTGEVAAVLLLHGSRQVQLLQIVPALSILLGALLASLGVSAVFGRRFARSVEGPLSEMSAAAQRLTDGDYTARCGYRSDDEIGKLAENLDELAGRLAHLREESEAQEEQRREFLASISHELRTPVTVIRGSLETLSDGIVEDPARAAEYTEQMLTEVLQLERLVSDLMDLTRMESASFALRREVVQLSDVLSDAVRSMRQIAREKNVTIQLEENEACNVLGDYTRLKQMFTVVLDNAVKFSPPGGVIRVSSVKEGDIVRTEIADQGEGIPADQLPRIFERFYTRAPSGGNAGTGLGLPIARSISERHGIDIRAKSRPGEGTVFVFRIPPTSQMPGE